MFKFSSFPKLGISRVATSGALPRRLHSHVHVEQIFATSRILAARYHVPGPRLIYTLLYLGGRGSGWLGGRAREDVQRGATGQGAASRRDGELEISDEDVYCCRERARRDVPGMWEFLYVVPRTNARTLYCIHIRLWVGCHYSLPEFLLTKSGIFPKSQGMQLRSSGLKEPPFGEVVQAKEAQLQAEVVRLQGAAKEMDDLKVLARRLESELAQARTVCAELKAENAVAKAKMAQMQESPAGVLQAMSYASVQNSMPDLHHVSARPTQRSLTLPSLCAQLSIGETIPAAAIL